MGKKNKTKPGDGFLFKNVVYIILKAIFCLKNSDGCEISLFSAGFIYNLNILIFLSRVSFSWKKHHLRKGILPKLPHFLLLYYIRMTSNFRKLPCSLSYFLCSKHLLVNLNFFLSWHILNGQLWKKINTAALHACLALNLSDQQVFWPELEINTFFGLLFPLGNKEASNRINSAIFSTKHF